ncbi:glutaredoxin family protein [Candidatus Gracilibacteria bacterium]|nr:glutaredoxin family protein [Candidatus Gracilibacteria bacterium]
MNQITLYTKNNCPFCILAKNLLNSLDLTYDEIDITSTPGLIMDLVKKSGMRTVPQIFVGDRCLGGYDAILALHKNGELTKVIGL